jgi:hypothetical protein
MTLTSQQFNADIVVRNGKVTQAKLEFGGMLTDEEGKKASRALLNKTLHEIHDWQQVLLLRSEFIDTVRWMNTMLGVPADVSTSLAGPLIES